MGQQSKNLDCENRRLEHKVEILKDSNDVCECIIALRSFNISKAKKDQVLAKRDIQRFQSGGVKARLVNARIPSNVIK